MTVAVAQHEKVESAELSTEYRAGLDAVIATVNQIILGKEYAVRLALSTLLARGHLLIEDLPGMGKTTLSHAIAQVLGMQYQRVQFTSDLLPADILGAAIYERSSESFVFHPGPIFNQLILADEINRATPKTQSALLEAMEERQVTVEGETRALPEPFFVIATQNPSHQVGTFMLPESQLDRFAVRLTMGYPDANAERALLAGNEPRAQIPKLPVCLTPAQLLAIQRQVPYVYVSDALLDYLQKLLAQSRQAGWFRTGLSPRAGQVLLRVARSWALLHHRQFVSPEDVQQVIPGVIGHRLIPADAHLETPLELLIERLIESIDPS